MDEQYVEPQTDRSKGTKQRKRCLSLTGVLIPTNVHSTFRQRFYQEIATALNIDGNNIPEIPEIHASNLFREQPDAVKYHFLKGIVSICLDLNFLIYRVGYYRTLRMDESFKDPKSILGLCFLGLLSCLKDQLIQNEIWPVMETDNTKDQDRHFAGQVQQIDYLSSLIGRECMSIDNCNLGELHYTTKRSSYGSVADCISYMLDARFLLSSGHEISPFKRKLAEIAVELDPLIMFDEIIEMKFEKPPSGYIGEGPFRYTFPISPTARSAK
ncbi:hypothetical protein [Rhizobium sp. J15]|uniref:hypothetical protein n=1 Tax=Rhizobium sp. J15 TaxID=2035450 RepID=UPI001144318B|nr:hypothetical protein [Rhizobium sp. J15]